MNKSDTAVNESGPEWQALAALAQKGDKSAYNRLLHEIIPYIRSVLGPRLAREDWVDDVIQEVLISVHKSLYTYSPDRPFKPWLTAIIHFRKTDFLRKYYARHGHEKTDLDDQRFIREHVTESLSSGELKDIEKALESFPEQQQKLFTMMKIEGYSAKECAEQMNMSVSAVKVSVHRTTNKLKKMLNE
jgi:RNA polymerase sigma-70 factor (ECF subfamily)